VKTLRQAAEVCARLLDIYGRDDTHLR